MPIHPLRARDADRPEIFGDGSGNGAEIWETLCRILYIPLCIVYAARYTVSGVVARYRAYDT